MDLKREENKKEMTRQREGKTKRIESVIRKKWEGERKG